MKTAALIPHPTDYYGFRDVELIDERQATRIAIAYDDGAYRTIERVFRLGGPDDHEAARVLHRRFAPTYAEIRDFLIGDCNVPRLLAARIALRLTRRVLS